MEKFVMLRRRDDGAWEHVGAQEVEVEEHENVAPQVRAAKQVGTAGVFVAVPFEDWVMLEAEAQITVRPVGRMPRPGEIEAEDNASGEPRDDLDPDDLEGMARPGDRLP
jgi:hypothetical protein